MDFDSTRWSNVLHFVSTESVNYGTLARFGNGWLLGEGVCTWNQHPSSVSWADADHDLIGWKFKTTQPAIFYVIVGCSGGEERFLMYKTGSGTDTVGCRYLQIHLGSLGNNLTDGTWHSIERNVQTDLARLIPGLTVTQIRGFAVRAGDLYFDDLRLGPSGDEAFDFASRLDGTKTASQWTNQTYVTSVYDTARRSDVIKVAATHWVIHGLNHYLGGTWDYNVSGARTLSAWVKSTGAPEFIVSVETTAGLRPLRYQWNGTPTAAPYAWTGATPNVPLFGCGFTADGVWHRLERNLAADASAAYPGETLLRVRGMTFNAYTQDLYLDDVRLSNAMTVEHNTMGPGVVGHILRVTQTDPTTYAQAHRWLHYDQVGSVLSESDATGNLAQRHEQDTFGNTLSSWQTGLIGGDRAGWHHNTKEWDGDIGLVYMYQRWYSPEVGGFLSRAPFPPHMEDPFSFAGQNPIGAIDPKGTKWNPPDFPGDPGWWDPEDLPSPPCSPTMRPNPYSSSDPRYSNDWAGWAMHDYGVPRLAAGAVASANEFIVQPFINQPLSYLFYGVPANTGVKPQDILLVQRGWDAAEGKVPEQPCYDYKGPAYPPPNLCPRIDGRIDGMWTEVGRAIKFNKGSQNERAWTIRLPQPIQHFRIVEDEPEVSSIKWIRGDGEDWGLGSITTTPASAFGAEDGSILEFEFSKPVTTLDTFGYYELVEEGHRFQGDTVRNRK